MNILPKKRWHVRNKDNIARVRKDEAEAAEKEKEIDRRRRLAEQEAKIEFMRKQTQDKYGIPSGTESPAVEKPVDRTPSVAEPEKLEHVNFFKDLEDGAVVTNATNKDHDQEAKEEKEKYEKQIGYLTYLGQDTNEATGKVSWYEKPRTSLLDDDDGVENDVKKKTPHDPLFKYKRFFDARRFVPKPANDVPEVKGESEAISQKKRKKRKKDKSKSKRRERSTSSSSSSSEDELAKKVKKQRLLALRDKRLKREREEKARADKVLARMRGEVVDEPVKKPEPAPYVQKYNSQFNPHLAKQNAIK